MEDPTITLFGIELFIVVIMSFFRLITQDRSWNKWIAIVIGIFTLIDLIAIPQIITKP